VAWPHGDPDAVARSVLAQPAYHVPSTTAAAPHADLLTVIFEWLGKLLHPLAHWLEGAAGSARPFGTLAGALVLAAVLGVLALLLWRIVNALLKDPPRPRLPGGFAGGTLTERSATDWRELAERAAHAGDYARAIAALFSGALAALDERALVPFDAARTPGEYRRLVRRAKPALAGPFDALSRAFVRAAFAPSVPQRDDYERAAGTYDALVPALAA
jgi:hypothetical protein